uniref:Uncharacterized protein n=1 Tax=Candidatus Kentrum sp. UNK TaxID=2126344 RepID=A0A451B359_9GAMM|nr:MAG: hypothetical protein BECKUNK1418G_GA0071005_11308 [Candidatus Kentron sp. UNK]VFK72705.1 MAG: hypothetical protein BECKUNK1418H_GA0071006_11326 [Candidatus Kentron sp. UNK]
MDKVMSFERRTDTEEERASNASSGGGGMDSLERRVERLEIDVREVKIEIAKMNTRMDIAFPTFATREDFMAVRAEIETVRTEVEKVRTEVEKVRTGVEKVRGEIERMGRVIIMWSVGTIIATAGIVTTISLTLSRYMN